MEDDIKVLEDKLMQLITLCQRLRSENSALRADVVHAQQEAQQLKTNMSLASTRLQALIERLPEDAL